MLYRPEDDVGNANIDTDIKLIAQHLNISPSQNIFREKANKCFL